MRKEFVFTLLFALVTLVAYAAVTDLDGVAKVPDLWPTLESQIDALQENVGTYTEGEDVATRLDSIEEDVGTYTEGEDIATDVDALQTDVIELTPVAGETYDADEDFTTDAATVADNVAYVYVNITDSADDNVLTLPTGAENLGKDLILYVNSTYSGGTLDVVMSAGVTAEEVENGKYHFNCIDTATWTEVGGCQAIQELQPSGLPAAKDETWVAANATYTIPDKQAGISIDSTSAAGNNTVLTLPSGAECIGDMCTVIVSCDGGTADTVDVYLGTLNGTLEDVDNGKYLFACIATGQWARLPVGQSDALTDWGPGASITGDISSYNETTLKAVLTVLENVGLITDSTT